MKAKKTRAKYIALLTKGDITAFNLWRSEDDFASIDLSCAKLQGRTLEKAGLQSTNLSNADLSNANLRGANLTDAVLTNAILDNTCLKKARLRNANLQGIDLIYTDLSKADLRCTNIRNCEVLITNMYKARVSEPHFDEVLKDAEEWIISMCDRNSIVYSPVDAKLLNKSALSLKGLSQKTRARFKTLEKNIAAIPRSKRILFSISNYKHDKQFSILHERFEKFGYELIPAGMGCEQDEIISQAIKYDVDAIWISNLLEPYIRLGRYSKLAKKLTRRKKNIMLFCGGPFFEESCRSLQQIGFHGTFPTGTPIKKIVAFVTRWLGKAKQ